MAAKDSKKDDEKIEAERQAKLHEVVRNFFENLGLLNQKISLQDALTIREDTLNEVSCSNAKKLPFLILQKIMAYDYQSRTSLLKLPSERNASSESETDTDDSDSDDEVEESDDIDLSHYTSSGDSKVHPMDGILALFYCADDFLRQDMMVRLSSCQMAIPLVLRDPFTQELTFPLWALSAIVKSWRTKDSGGKKVDHETQIVDHSMPIISFIRLGKCKQKKSKSKLLNDVISNAHYDHFFHRDCNGGEFKRLLGNGVIDVCWYLPGGKENVFPNPVTFLNLHGSACSKHNKNQVAFLSEISTLCFALVAGKTLDTQSVKILEKFRDFTLLVSGKKLKNLKDILQQKVQTISLKRNADEVKRSIRDTIMQKVFVLDQQPQCMSIRSCSQAAKNSHILIDEDAEQFKIGKNFAESSLKAGISDQDFKSKALPLQSKTMWQEWAKNDKEQYRQVNRGAKEINLYAQEIKKKKREIRVQQGEKLHDLHPIMVQFMTNLQAMTDKTLIHYYLYCLKLGLNNRSRTTIAGVHQMYQDTRLKLTQVQAKLADKNNEASTSPEETKLKEQLDSLHQKLIEITFGLEHLLREVGQVYETAIMPSNERFKKQFCTLPTAAAQLLTNGYPLEVMDGDAAHVPIEWVTAVLNEAVSLLNDPRIFILSVLGLQSTGKSTLLNTTFGLQFNVSSGRCTRGAYMQLLPISEELQESVKCDYVLVVDTEGLRAPELDSQQSQKHDNELATFVIGLANETLINIYGEVAGDMDDILQTAVHAFIRMRAIELKPSCQFIHQNAGAGVKTGIGRDRFVQKLDQMTRFAAKEERCEHRFKKFSDVIKFDDQKDVHHFECLWMGDPPMAPVNLGYSKSAQSLKFHLIEEVRKTPCTRLSSFSSRMHDLWDALLKENFVFSFKNSVEINAFNALETKYSEWECELKDKVLELGQKLENEIIAASKSPERLDQIIEQQLHPSRGKLSTAIDKERSRLKELLSKYFEQSKQSDVISQWKSTFDRKLEEQAEILKQEAINRFNQLCDGKKALTNVLQQQEKYKADIISKVGEIAQELKRNKRELSEMQLEEEFKKIWEDIKRRSPSVRRLQDSKQVKIDVERELLKFLRRGNEQLVIEAQNAERGGSTELHFKIKKEIHIVRKTDDFSSMVEVGVKRLFRSDGLSFTHERKAQSLTTIVFNNASHYLQSVRNSTYNPTYTTKMLQKLEDAIDSMEAESKELSFTHKYRVDVYSIACNHATKKFEKMVETFNRDNDPVVYLEKEFKAPLYKLFKNKYHQIAHEKAVASALSDLLEKCIEKQVKRSLGRQIVKTMRPSGVHFSNKQALKAKILVDLAEKLQANRDFSHFILYLSDPRQSFRYWAREYTRQYCEKTVEGSQKTQLQSLAISTVESLFDFTAGKISEVSRKFETVATSKWVSDFSEDKSVIENLGLVDTSTIDGTETINVASFTASVKEELENAKKKVTKEFEHLCFKHMENWEERAEDILGDMAGCCEKCPFCGEVCDNTHVHGKDVKHYVEQHRPQCVDGWRNISTQIMSLGICASLVTGEDKKFTTFRHPKTNMKSHPYKFYQKIFPDWRIPADLSSDASKYWKWFVANYAREISEHYSMKLCSIPSDWSESWSTVKADLEKKYN